MKKIVDFKIALKEIRNGRWLIELWRGKSMNGVEYDTFDQAIKELKRAVEMRESVKAVEAALKKELEIKK